jgi:hypothetical protein
MSNDGELHGRRGALQRVGSVNFITAFIFRKNITPTPFPSS